MKKLMLILILGMFFISFASADLGTVKQDDCISLYQYCPNCSYVNLTAMKYPNATVDFSLNEIMTKTNSNYNYTWCSTSALGEHFYTVCGDKTGSAICEEIKFEVTPNGDSLEDSDAMLYMFLLGLLVFLFVINIYAITKIPNGKVTDMYGQLIGIDNIKYLKPVLFAVGWGLLLAITFITSNIALAYLNSELMGQFFFMMYKVLMVLSLPIVVILLVYLLISIFRDNETKRMLERGLWEDGI